MVKSRPKPPAEIKADVKDQVARLLQMRYAGSHEDSVIYLLEMFTTFDLITIRDELREAIRRNKK